MPDRQGDGFAEDRVDEKGLTATLAITFFGVWIFWPLVCDTLVAFDAGLAQFRGFSHFLRGYAFLNVFEDNTEFA